MALNAYKNAMTYLCGGQPDKEPKITLITVEELDALYGSKSDITKKQIDELREKLKNINYEDNLLQVVRTKTDNAEVNNV